MGIPCGRTDFLGETLTFERFTVGNPPPTWGPYLEDDDAWGIVEMEFNEAKQAVEKLKSGSGSVRDVVKELGHVASAAAHARAQTMRKACRTNSEQQEDAE